MLKEKAAGDLFKMHMFVQGEKNTIELNFFPWDLLLEIYVDTLECS